jgi:hypothetical protein
MSEGHQWSKLSQDITAFLHTHAVGMQLSTPVIIQASVLADPKRVAFVRNILLRATQDMPLHISTPLQCVMIAFETEVACALLAKERQAGGAGNGGAGGTSVSAEAAAAATTVPSDKASAHVAYVRSLSKALLALSDILKPSEEKLGMDILQIWIAHAAMEMRFGNDQGASRALDQTVLTAKQLSMAGPGNGDVSGGGPEYFLPLLVLTHVRMILWPHSSFENAAVVGHNLQDEGVAGGGLAEKSWRSQPVGLRRALALHALCGFVEHQDDGAAASDTSTVRKFQKDILKGVKSLQKRRRKEQKQSTGSTDGLNSSKHEDVDVYAHDYVECAKGQLGRMRILKAKNAYLKRLEFTLANIDLNVKARKQHLRDDSGNDEGGDNSTLHRMQAQLMEVCNLSACLALFQYLSTWWISESGDAASAGVDRKQWATTPSSSDSLGLEAALVALDPVLAFLRERYTEGYGPLQSHRKQGVGSESRSFANTNSGDNSTSLVNDLNEDCTSIQSRMRKDREARFLAWRLSLEHGTIDVFQSQFAGALEWVELFQIELISQHSLAYFDIQRNDVSGGMGAKSSPSTRATPPRVSAGLPPYRFRQILQKALNLFPANPTLLGLFLDVERNSRSSQRVNTHISQTINRCMWVGPSLSEWFFMIQFEVQRAEADMAMNSLQGMGVQKRWNAACLKRIRSLFERALNSTNGIPPPPPPSPALPTFLSP